ncbi:MULTISPECIES: ABC transporter substrate-binding protein [unclassified Planococcus (in: firmicutes)]|uniref:ABC transporter substrate-binding protein n=1 Tax=unclassified Planococcus (in: firmicutes) TaxID=2662419 RepID=UPI000C348DDA|nr:MULTISPECIES: ABC transporter substrate-binding protein [unclassified Planococcus (in: firmicutes)]AUD13223.1 cobalamin-binding protein [Planococcus sp. MB-3u-03]PKG46010.1 cobalamin-binding protein [Planococcus sp. Urea-trap-24]PKG89116.1 cobalamin-binding protein [Planococcus sp. Urea-3u-39]PKH39136.1 cobalamin-binding protein [Planococcus sp. MB-3u-09]
MKIKSFLLLSIPLSLTLGACQDDTAEVPATDETTEETPTETASDAPYTVTDDRGEELEFEQAPETIVSLIPSNTEIVFALDSGDQLVGVTDYDNYPEAAQDIERVSDSVEFNAEKIIQLDPDVVLAYSTGEAPPALSQLEDADIPVFVIESATSFDEVYGDIEQIASVLAKEEKGAEVIEGIQTQIEDVQERLAAVEEQKEVYVEISPSPEIYTTGKSTFMQEILNHAQVTNVFEDLEGWPNISEEEVITRDPEVILTTVSYVEDAVGDIEARDSWSDVEAIENDEVHFIDSDITSRPGPRIGEAVQLVAETVYPELME